MINWLMGWFSDPEESTDSLGVRRTFELTPLDPFSVSFIELKDKPDSYITYVIPQVRSCAKSIQNKIDYQKKNPPKLLPQIETVLSEEQRKVAISIDIYNKSLKKIDHIQYDLYEKALLYCEQIIEFAQNVVDHKYPIKIDYSNFIKKINNFISKSPEISRLNLLTKVLSKRVVQPASQAPPTAKQVYSSILSELQNYDIRSKYMEESCFDEVFEKYVSSNSSIMSQYNEILNEMSLFEYAKSLDDLFALTKSISSGIGIVGEECNEFWILFYTSARFFFNRVTLQLPYLLSNDLSATKFIKNCDIIQNKTPSELKASPNIFLPSQFDISVINVFGRNDRLNKAINFLSLMQFYNNPLDIANLADHAIEIFNTEITSNIYKNKNFNGDPDVEVPKAVFEAETMIAFDDLFTFFYMALSIYPPANATALLIYLRAFGNFTQSQSIDYASTTLQAAVKYICDYNQ